MGIRRACSCVVTIKTPKAPETYSAMLFTVEQDGEILVSKNLGDLTWDDDYVYAKMTQEETAQFTAGVPAWMQLRLYASEYDAPGSCVKQVEVWPSIDDQILSGGE